MKTIALIPARYAATRFPGKLMQMLGGKTVIRRTYENTLASLLLPTVKLFLMKLWKMAVMQL